MHLPAYLELSGLTQKQLAMLLEVHVTTVWKWIHGERKPGSTMVMRIEMLTQGKVTLRDLEAYWKTKKK